MSAKLIIVFYCSHSVYLMCFINVASCFSSCSQALDENPSLAFVRPRWIIVCHEKGAFVPFQPYIIVPS